VACGYSLIISKIIYKKLSFNDLKKSLATTVKTSASVYLIVGFTAVISWILAIEGVPALIQGWVAVNKPSPYVMLFLVNLFFLFNGMWLSDTAQLVLFAPLFTPIMVSLGIHPIHFGVIMVVNVMIGMITPPYGLALYLSASIAQVPLKALVREIIPFVSVSIAVLFLVTYVPLIVLGVPRYLGLIQ
jgi:tripartite ATP-independent transporter DctM subunit